jgi:hypothetical protein
MAYAELTADLRQILRRRSVRNAVTESSGEQSDKVLEGWIEQFSLGGVRDASTYQSLMRALNSAVGRAARIALIGRASTVLVQTTQIGAAQAEMPMAAYWPRLAKLLTGQLGWSAAFRSRYIQNRLRAPRH